MKHEARSMEQERNYEIANLRVPAPLYVSLLSNSTKNPPLAEANEGEELSGLPVLATDARSKSPPLAPAQRLLDDGRTPRLRFPSPLRRAANHF